MKLKKIGCIFVAFCMVISLSACLGKTTLTNISIPEKPFEDEDKGDAAISDIPFIDLMICDKRLENEVVGKREGDSTPISVEWQMIKLGEEDSKKYPKLAAAFEKNSNDTKTNAKKSMDDFVDMAEEANTDDYTLIALESEEKIYVQRADDNIVSYVHLYYGYSGGAHGNYGWTGENYNPETGKKISLSELVTDTKSLKPIIISELDEKYEDYVFFMDLEEMFVNYNIEDLKWSVDYEGITFWFSPYEIASFAAGTLTVKLRFDEYPELFNKKYTEVPSDYIVELPMNNDMEFDLIEDDGKTDSVNAYIEYETYRVKGNLALAVNDLNYTDKLTVGNRFKVYLVHNDGKKYILSEAVSVDGYHTICVYDISGNEVKQIDKISGAGFYWENEGDATYSCIPINTEKIKILTDTGKKVEIYKVNEDGRLIKVDK